MELQQKGYNAARMMDARTKNRPSPLPLGLASFRVLHASISVVRRALQ
jgi:hypothetical protein